MSGYIPYWHKVEVSIKFGDPVSIRTEKF